MCANHTNNMRRGLEEVADYTINDRPLSLERKMESLGDLPSPALLINLSLLLVLKIAAV